MMGFQQKVAALRSCESITYTICLKLLIDERAAAEAAKGVLLALYQDTEHWNKEETQQRTCIMRLCFTACQRYLQETYEGSPSSNVS